WRSRFLRYIDTRQNGDALRKCILNGPYIPTTIVVQPVAATDDSPVVPEHTTVEIPMNMSSDNKAHFESEKEAIHLILTGIGDEIYLTVDAFQTAQEMWEAIERLQQETMESYYTLFYKLTNEMIRKNLTVATMQVNVQFLQQLQPKWSRFVMIVKQQHKLDEVSYHKLFDILKQYQKEVNELRAERLARNANPLALVATVQANQDPYYQTSKSQKSYAPSSKPSIPTRSHTTTRYKGKEIAKPITPPSESASEEDSHPEQAQRDKDMQKNLALIVQTYQQQPQNFLKLEKQECGYDSTECRKPKRVKDSAYHKEKMLLCKQAEKGVPLQAEQYDGLADTVEEIDEQDLEAHYNYMAKIQEVPTADPGTDSEPLEKTQNDSFIFVHELKQEMHADLKYVESLEKEIDELEFHKAEFSNIYDMKLQECVSNEVMCTYLLSLSDLDMLAELQCLYLHKVKECDCLAQKLSKQTESTNSVPKTNVSEGLSKTVTTQTLPQIARQTVSNTNVLKLGLYRIDTRTTQTRAPQSPQTFRNTNPRVSNSTGVNHKTNVYRPQHRSNQMKDKVMPNNSQVKLKKTQVDDHPRILSISNKIKSVTACNDSLNSRTSNVNAVCATCGKCLIDSDHFACVTKMLNDVNARTKKPNVVPISTRKPKGHANKSVATPHKKKVTSKSTTQKPKSYYRMRDLQGNDLLTGNHGSDLYTISLQESTSSTPLHLMAKASPTQAWLWHRRLSHLNFDYINLLSKKDVVIGLPKLKYVNEQLCSFFEVSKAKKSSFKSKVVPSSKGRLNLLHMDLCGPLRVTNINGKKYILVIIDDYSRNTWTLFLRSKDETPEVLKRVSYDDLKNLQAPVITVRTDRGTKTALSKDKTALWLRLLARSQLQNFLYSFGLKDAENLDKKKEKGDPCILMGYSTQSQGPRSLRQKALDSDNSDPVPQLQNVSSSADAHVPSQQELDLLFGPLYDIFFTTCTSSVNKSSSPTNNSNQQDTQPTTNIQPPSKPSTPTYVHAEENNDNQAEEEHLQDDEFTNPFCTSVHEVAESSSHNIGNSNVHTFNQPQVFEYQWTKDHPLKQVRGNPSKPVQTRRQLGTYLEMCMFTHTVSTAKPKNIKEAMADSAWIKVMQEELHQFNRLQMLITLDALILAKALLEEYNADKLVNWMSKKQDCTAMSSAKAKYVALSASCAQSAIAISCNLVQHSRTKHIYTRYHFIKEQVKNGIIELYFVRTEYQLGDMLTKALPEDRFKYLVRRISMRCLTPAELEVLAKESA
nr:retrovirus-related Pol polyprotein from transposon TNT 1-94 [Tanacetum cinerariifolium]